MSTVDWLQSGCLLFQALIITVLWFANNGAGHRLDRIERSLGLPTPVERLLRAVDERKTK